VYTSGTMTRGNQRELAREKATKKQQQASKSQGANNKAGNSGMSTEKRMERDAEIMRQKQAEKAAAAAAKAEQSGNQPKVVKIDPLKDL